MRASAKNSRRKNGMPTFKEGLTVSQTREITIQPPCDDLVKLLGLVHEVKIRVVCTMSIISSTLLSAFRTSNFTKRQCDFTGTVSKGLERLCASHVLLDSRIIVSYKVSAKIASVSLHSC
jgi:hypothetical protein